MVNDDISDRDIKSTGQAVAMGTFDKTSTTLQTISRSGSGMITGISGYARLTTAGAVAAPSGLYVEIKPTLDGVLSGTTDHYIIQYESGDTSRKDFFRIDIPLIGRYESTCSITMQLFGPIGSEIATAHVVLDVFENRNS